MYRLVAPLVLLLAANLALGQVTKTIPPRLQPLAKNARFKLTRILGTPEMRPIFAQTTAFSTDGKRAVYIEDLSTAATLRSRLVIWDVAAKTWPREVEIEGAIVDALDLTPDGKTALLALRKQADKADKGREFVASLALWDLDDAKPIRSFATPRPFFGSVALAPDGKSALAGELAHMDRWDLATGKVVNSYGDKGKAGVATLAWLPGGKRFLAGGFDGATRVFAIDNGNPTRTFKTKGESQLIWHLAASEDGKRFAAGNLSSVSLFETDTGKEINTLRIAKPTVEEAVTGLAFAADAKTVYVVWGKAGPDADDFQCAKLYAWDAQANKVLWSALTGHRGRVPIRIDGDKLQVGGGPNAFDTWDVRKGKRLETWGGHKSTVNVVAALPNGQVLSGGQEGSLLIWGKDRLLAWDDMQGGPITALALHPKDGSWLSAGADQTIRHASEMSPPGRPFDKKHTGTITSLAFDPSGTWAVSASTDRTIRAWSISRDGGKQIAVLDGHPDSVNAVAVSPDGRWVASGCSDTTVRLWPVLAGKRDPDRDVVFLEKHKKPVTCLAFSPDGKTLLSGGQDQKLIAWDWKKGSMDFMIAGHKNYVTSLVFVDASTVISASDDLSVCMWDLSTGTEVGRIDFGAAGDCPRALALAGNRLYVGSASWLIYEFEIMPAGKSKTGGKSSKR